MSSSSILKSESRCRIVGKIQSQMLTQEYRPVVSSFWMALVPTLVELEGTSVDLDVGGKGG
ncbi:unnamed protein product [Prunus armeniaca]|uniref:Uncharacterized protein n=1 Tax=Prunus armeniaca TaxID=36596 RepID=A0A6J5UPF2_PRUAR|nr:unnamed protein product [Prunus armeniaca]